MAAMDAQGLGLGCTLRSLGFLQARRWKDRLEELRFRLETFVTDSGAMSFRRLACSQVHFNTWAAIFISVLATIGLAR